MDNKAEQITVLLEQYERLKGAFLEQQKVLKEELAEERQLNRKLEAEVKAGKQLRVWGDAARVTATAERDKAEAERDGLKAELKEMKEACDGWTY